MKKNLLIILLTLLVATIFTSVINYIKIINFDVKNNKFINNKTLKESMNDDKPTIVLFYANWCSYCVKFLPIFNDITKDFSKNYNFIIIDIDKPENKSFAKDNASSLPCLYIFDSKIKNKILVPIQAYSNKELLKIELERYLRIRSYIDFNKVK